MSVEDPIAAKLRQPLQPQGKHSRILRALGSEAPVYGVMTLGDLVYDAARLRMRDELAVQAFDFARSADLQDIYRLAQFATDVLNKPAPALNGDVSQLQGYVFERMAGVFFERQGAEVEFPATSNHPSADLRINGEWFQAKCTTSPAIIRRHFERNPDVPVLVNEDIAGHFATDPRVMGIPGVTSDSVRASTNQALSDAAEILDFEICLYVPASTAARVALAWFKGDTDLVGAAAEAGMGTTGRALGAGMGKALAASAVVATGLTGWPAIILPLAAAVGGSIGGRSATTWLKQTILGRGPTAALRQSVGAYCLRAATRLENILSISADQLALWRKLQADASSQWHGIIDNWISRLEDQRDRQALALRRLRAAAQDPESLEKHGGPLHSAYRAATLAGGAGVTPRELFSETQDLTMAIEAYQKAMQRHFLRTI